MRKSFATFFNGMPKPNEENGLSVYKYTPHKYILVTLRIEIVFVEPFLQMGPSSYSSFLRYLPLQ